MVVDVRLWESIHVVVAVVILAAIITAPMRTWERTMGILVVAWTALAALNLIDYIWS